jgi:hypothetical protein
MRWVTLSLRQFRLLHQITKEVPNLDPAVFDTAAIPATLARHLLDVVRRGRAAIGDSGSVRIGFDEGVAPEVLRDVSTWLDDDVLNIDTGTTTAGAAAWVRLASATAATLGMPEFHHRTGGSPHEAEEVFELVGKAATEPRGDHPS